MENKLLVFVMQCFFLYFSNTIKKDGVYVAKQYLLVEYLFRGFVMLLVFTQGKRELKRRWNRQKMTQTNAQRKWWSSETTLDKTSPQ